MDNVLVEHILQEFVTIWSGWQCDKAAMMRIREGCREGQDRAVKVVTTEINLPFLAYDQSSGPKNLNIAAYKGEA